MRATSWVVLAMLIGSLGGCGDDGATTQDSAPVVDLGPQADAGPDTASPDGAPAPDTQPTDTSPATDATPDAAQLDAGQPDAVQPDAVQPDAAQPDAGQPDAGQPDAAQPDAAQPDATAIGCTPNPCQHGGSCTPTAGGYTCTCAAGWKGPTCMTPSYCDVVYRVSGSFHTTNAPLIGQFTKAVGTNASLPPFSPARTTPFTPTAFANGFMRLRFPNLGGAPAPGMVALVEYYMPMEFSVTTLGTTVNTDVDHSAGMLQLSGTPPVIGDPPTLSRGCAAVASGTLTGTTLAWGSCSAVPDGTTSWTFTKAQSSDPGCLHRMSSFGNVSCTSGLCGMVGGLGNQRETWDQMLSSFQFSGSNLATATFTMAEVQTPNTTNVRTYVAITATSVVKVECDTAGPLTCDEQ